MSIVNVDELGVQRPLFKGDKDYIANFLEKRSGFQSEAEKALGLGRDMVEHFTAFVEGKEDSFTRYFVVSDESHNTMHKGFWDELGSQYPGMVVLDFPDRPEIRQYVFTEQSAALIARTDLAHNGEVSGIEYQATWLPDQPLNMLGRIAAAQAMQ